VLAAPRWARARGRRRPTAPPRASRRAGGSGIRGGGSRRWAPRGRSSASS
jgi:hypothetical protein